MTKMLPINGPEKSTLNKKLENVVVNCEDKQKKLFDALDKSKKELETSIMRISVILNAQFALAMKAPTFNWSEKLKGHKIKINGSIAEQTAMESSGQRFVMI